MAQYFENLGMGFMLDDEETMMGMVGYAVENGDAIVGYYGHPYFNYHYGSVQMVIRTELDKENEKIEMTGVDSHVSGNAVWKMRCRGMNITPKDAGKTEKRCMFSDPKDGSGMLIVNLVNSDVIPSYLEDDIIEMQVVAFPEHIEYFANEDDYSDSLPESELGKKWGVENGSFFPVGFLSNHRIEDIDAEKDDWKDNLILVRGIVKELYINKVIIEEEEISAYICCRIETMYGDLDIVHVPDQVDEKYRDNIMKGAIVSAIVTLSGDVAIFDYEKGIVKDEEHNLRLLRSTFEGGDPERMRLVLSKDVVYKSDSNHNSYVGKDDVIERFKYVQSAGSKYYSYFATIEEVEDVENMRPAGTRCIVLAYNDPDNYETIAFIDCDDEGKICGIHTCADPRYKFAIDESSLEVNLFEGMHMPDSYVGAMLARAGFHGFICPDEVDEQDFATELSEVNSFESNAKDMLAAWPDTVDSKDDELTRRVFGYLFAKAIEAKYTSKSKDMTYKLIASYNPGKAFDDVYDSAYEGKLHDKLVTAMKYGKQFYTDFLNYIHVDDDIYDEELIKAIVVVQCIGDFCAEDYMESVI